MMNTTPKTTISDIIGYNWYEYICELFPIGSNVTITEEENNTESFTGEVLCVNKEGNVKVKLDSTKEKIWYGPGQLEPIGADDNEHKS